MSNETEISSWNDLPCKLSKNTKVALKGLKFKKPTPIQSHVIPNFLKKKDIVAQAVTGSGKTLAFIIPIIELLNKMDSIKSTDVFAVILSPTSELANQTFEMFKSFFEHFNGSKPNLKLFNKKSANSEVESNKGIILISTPGAFAKAIDKTVENADLIKSLKSAEILILDEADRLLEMGFEDQLLTIIKGLPKQRLTGLFSATQTTQVEDLIRAGLRNPVRVSVKVKQGEEKELNDNIPKNLTNYYMILDKENKLDILIKFLNDKSDKKILIFLATCSCVDYYKNILSHILKKQTFLAFHKKLKTKRSKIFDQFKNMEKGVMLCTDVMARGIDIPDIDWVIQYDPPKSATNFVHRCGRTARCDQFGQTLMFLRSSEEAYLHFLRSNQNVEMQEFHPEFSVDELPSQETRMQNLCVADRLLYEKSVNAFISYVMFYKKHELQYIFKLKDLNMGKLANGFGLLRIPQMAELKGIDLSDFHDRKIDLTSLIYKDKSVRKVRELTRIKKKERREEAEALQAEQAEEGDDNNKQKTKSNGKKNNKKKTANNKNQPAVSTINVESMEVDDDEEIVEKSAKNQKTIVEKQAKKPLKRKSSNGVEKEGANKKPKFTATSRQTEKVAPAKPVKHTEKAVETKPVTTKQPQKVETAKKFQIEGGSGILASFNKANKL